MIRAVILLGGPSRKASYGAYEQASPLFPVSGIEIIGHLLNSIHKMPNLKDFVLMGYYDKKCFQQFQEQYQKLYGKHIYYVQEQREMGTAGGLAQNLDVLFEEVEDLLVVHSDICCDLQAQKFYEYHKNKSGICSIMTVRVSKEESTRYGCLIKDPNTDQLIHHAEKPEQYISNLVNCGVYLFNQSFQTTILNVKAKKEANLSEELQDQPFSYLSLENDVLKLTERDRVFVYEHTGFWQSIKSTTDLLNANRLLLQYYRQNPFLFKNPEFEINGEGVLIHKSAKIHPTAKLGSNVVIGAGCDIGEGVRIKNSILLDGVEVKNFSFISNSIICYNTIIGYWCRIEGEVQFLGPCVIIDNELFLRDVICLQNCRVSESKDGGCLM
ncbi:unnamed protein product (macronuclear) [Paramecium tetraurelia]|uniref:Uncharacterized protein n=1 Tax=Paramecium tetraurelia TaxID=5888 RepID=A0CJH6_PARTE|nr:uncharacterized protein GSPATT00000654001 [Paramecium tetraurelia]CAK70943.1 unnamed protein product [Paramecium tetraurelia]|eukprot:XP_001438340.1 hypothetical protein (macronuclear) [Paramecium tetraurelia strain d4-2]